MGEARRQVRLLRSQAEYDPGAHRYKANGMAIPSVTQILAAARISDLSFVTQNALERGSRIHRLLEGYDRGNIRMDSVTSQDVPYVTGWADFKLQTRFKPALIEWPAWHPQYCYGGTPDRVGWIGKKLYVVEIKTGSAPKHTGIQLAAYAMLLRRKAKRLAVLLTPNGKHKPIPYDSPQDFSYFMAALTIYRCLREMGVQLREEV